MKLPFLPGPTFVPKWFAMSNIKWNYWVPVVGIALIMQNQGSYLNTREERMLVVFHVAFALLILAVLIASVAV